MKHFALLIPLLACAALMTGCAVEGPQPVLTGGAVYPSGGYGPDYGPGYGGGPYYGAGYGPGPIYGGGVALVETNVYTENDYYYRNGHRYLRPGRAEYYRNHNRAAYNNRRSGNYRTGAAAYNNRAANYRSGGGAYNNRPANYRNNQRGANGQSFRAARPNTQARAQQAGRAQGGGNGKRANRGQAEPRQQ